MWPMHMNRVALSSMTNCKLRPGQRGPPAGRVSSAGVAISSVVMTNTFCHWKAALLLSSTRRPGNLERAILSSHKIDKCEGFGSVKHCKAVGNAATHSDSKHGRRLLHGPPNTSFCRQSGQLLISVPQPAVTQILLRLLRWNLGGVGNKWYFTGKASMQIVSQVTEIIVTIKTRWRSYKKGRILFSVYENNRRQRIPSPGIGGKYCHNDIVWIVFLYVLFWIVMSQLSKENIGFIQQHQ
jgi:hypothetical protein